MKINLLFILYFIIYNSYSQDKIEWIELDNNVEYTNNGKKIIIDLYTDWCGWCKRLVKEVFVKPEFATWATKNVVLVELDFPRRTKLSAELQKQNRELGQMFGVRGYPTIWFVTPEIQESKVNFAKLGSQGYVAGGPPAWIAGADKIIKLKK